MPVTEVRDSGIEVLDEQVEAEFHEESEEVLVRLPEPTDIVNDGPLDHDVVIEGVEFLIVSTIDTTLDGDTTEAQMMALQIPEDELETTEDGDIILREANVVLSNEEGELGPTLVSIDEPDQDTVLSDFEERYTE